MGVEAEVGEGEGEGEEEVVGSCPDVELATLRAD